ncbi:hypothetical protein [Kitasatospora viridis]|uniref:Glycosyl transferase family 8 n=1 Tax=Kitasatospora viridis TaxID=281105 RepID=A0A561T6A0_9ACTN|nr:hypothetical protein [Kitasatospora viridis]TWF82633.1 hypothetical protein FHX73_14115 [Kitasatospora viridis]
MTRGYLTHAFNSRDVDYLRMAYCLALSLRLTQSTVDRLTVLVEPGQHVPAHYREVFDAVVELPVADRSRKDGWRVENFAELYGISPYDESVTLDSDMLFFDDVSGWWDDFAGQEVVAATAVDYRGRAIAHNPLRRNLYEIGLPDLHNGFLYFRRSEPVRELFATIAAHTRSWPETCRRHFGRTDVHYSSDCALLLALRDTGMEAGCVRASAGGHPAFVHMKACLQGWPGVSDTERDWRAHTDYRFSEDLRLTIGGESIGLPFHYHVRDFVDDRLLAAYERSV